MEQIATPLKDLLLLKPQVHGDHRGYFLESYNKQALEKLGLNLEFVQDNQSKSTKGIFRGLHYQKPPKAQTKLIRCLDGEILDVVVDLRPDSETFKKSYSVKLSSENFLQLLIPKGFAHGFLVLSDEATVAYKCDEFYSPEHEDGLHHLDPIVDIEWPMSPDSFILSERDKKWPKFS